MTAANVTPERDEMINAAMAEGELASSLDTLAEKEDVTVEDLRQALGATAQGLSDEELMAEWQKAQVDDSATAGEPKNTETAPTFALPSGLKLYDDKGVEVDVKALKPEEVAILQRVLGYQWGYQALGKEQRKTIDQIARVASLGHYNEQKMQSLLGERSQAMRERQEALGKIEQYEQDRRVWDQALTALANGNAEPIQRLAQAFQQALSTLPAQPAVSTQDAEFEQIGTQWFMANALPRATELAQQYNANVGEITQAMIDMFVQEGEFLTPAKIEAILQYEIPALLERNGYAANGQRVDRSTGTGADQTEIAALKKQVAELVAATKNAETQRLRGKRAPAAGGGSTPSGSEVMPDFKSKEDYKRWIRDEKD